MKTDIEALQEKVIEEMKGMMFLNFLEKKLIRRAVRLTYQYMKEEENN
jgi:hypothetical protein